MGRKRQLEEGQYTFLEVLAGTPAPVIEVQAPSPPPSRQLPPNWSVWFASIPALPPVAHRVGHKVADDQAAPAAKQFLWLLKKWKIDQLVRGDIWRIDHDPYEPLNIVVETHEKDDPQNLHVWVFHTNDEGMRDGLMIFRLYPDGQLEPIGQAACAMRPDFRVNFGWFRQFLANIRSQGFGECKAKRMAYWLGDLVEIGFVYTWRDAVEDGETVDVTCYAQEDGFTCPVTIGMNIFERIGELAGLEFPPGEEVTVNETFLEIMHGVLRQVSCAIANKGEYGIDCEIELPLLADPERTGKMTATVALEDDTDGVRAVTIHGDTEEAVS